MPTRPPIFGRRPRDERRRENDTARRHASPWRRWYSLAIWREIRARMLAEEPLCRRCKALGLVVPATTVNHVEPHRGDWELFVNGPFECLCKPHHDGEVQREERAAAKKRGFPGNATN